MFKDSYGIGTDIEEIRRFEGKTQDKDKTFLNRIFTKNELEYCFRTQNSAQHLCARFCGKEAIVKALNNLNIKDVFYSDIEILNQKDGAPYAIIEKYPELTIKISLSHCKTYATAFVIITEN